MFSPSAPSPPLLQCHGTYLAIVLECISSRHLKEGLMQEAIVSSHFAPVRRPHVSTPKLGGWFRVLDAS